MTSTSSPHDRIHSRISIVPDTVARQRSEPSASASSVCVGCQIASRTRAATPGTNRSTISTGSWSAMMSHAARSAEVVAAGSGGSNVRGVRAALRIRSILNVRSAPRSSSKPIRYSAWVWSDDGRDKVVHGGVVLEREQLGDAHGARRADARQVVAHQVHDHQVLGAVLGALGKRLPERGVVLGTDAARARAFDRPRFHKAVAVHAQEAFRRRADHVRRRASRKRRQTARRCAP